MPQENEQKTSSFDNNRSARQSKRQEEAFIASGNRRARMNKSDRGKNELQQFMLSESISGFNRTIEEFKINTTTELAHTDERIRKINSKVRKIKKDADKAIVEARNKIIEPLAIFVGLFTFASIGFQTFAQVKEYILWMPLLAIVLGGIIIFAGLIVYASALSDEIEKGKRNGYTLIIVGLGIFLVIFGMAYYNKAADVIRNEDNKTCILVQSDDKTAQTERYCKLTR